jgi:gliding motility-associated-like protein
MCIKTITENLSKEMIKKYPKLLFCLTILSLITAGAAIAQPSINVQDNKTAQQLVEYLVGTNVATMNPSLTCTAEHNGTYQNVSSNLPIGDGIVLSTGRVGYSPDPFSSGVSGPVGNEIGAITSSPGDQDLTDIINQVTNNACVLEFDFVPDIDTISTLRFNYSFASEEYNEYVCSGFNDVFAFLLSGPGIGSNVNVALVPGTNIPVAINSINNGTAGIFGNGIGTCNAMGPGSPFPAYFIDNEAINGQTVVFDGFTTRLEAQATVSPCDTYHIKLAVADAVDGILQSAVFLEGNSFRVDDVNLDFAGIVSVDSGYIAEGCNFSQFVASRDTTTPRPKKLCFTYTGTATNGVDYMQLPDTLILPPFTPQVAVSVVPIQDAIAEPGYETIVITRVNCCTKTPMDSTVLRIYDSLQIDLINVDTGMCGGAPIYLHVSGAPQFSYQWQPIATGNISNPNDTFTLANPVYTTNYSITASFLTCPPVTKSFKVTVDPIPLVNIRTSDTTICLSGPMKLVTDVQPDTFSQYSYVWGPNFGLDNPFAKEPFYYFDVPADYKYVLAVQTPLGCTGKDSILIRSKPSAELINVTRDTIIKYGQSVQLNADGANYYTWTPSTFLDFPSVNDPVATPLDTVTYELVGMNLYGCKDTAYVKVGIDFSMTEIVPNAFSPNGDGKNDVFRLGNIKYQKLQEFRVFNRYGEELFSTTNPAEGWDGTHKDIKQDVGVYHYLIRVALPGGEVKMYKGDVTLVR